CYIESSPTNDRLVYLTPADVSRFLAEIKELGEPTEEIGFTGGEPFLNPHMAELARLCLEGGYRTLILTNAMRPMMRAPVREALLELKDAYGDRLTLRLSIDHHTAALHDKERGAGTFDKTIEGARWLAENGFRVDAAGRTCWGETEGEARAGYARLFAGLGLDLDAYDAERCVLFPEMDEGEPTPEISTACWGILGVSPDAMMCASSRMVVKRKGAETATLAACTLLPYDERFDMGPSLKTDPRDVALNHPHCSRFCVLGGGSCS
ncbi:MAG: radical SAM protein, partial [Pseudomonadota bacterium]